MPKSTTRDSDVVVTPTALRSILDDVEHVEQQIRQRAYEISRTNGLHDSVSNWLDAERELVWQPPVEVRQTRGEFEVIAAVPGLNADDLDLRVTPRELLIKGSAAHSHVDVNGTIHVCEFSRGMLFRAVHLPERIDPDKVTADCRSGVLHITARIAVCIRPKRDTRQER